MVSKKNPPPKESIAPVWANTKNFFVKKLPAPAPFAMAGAMIIGLVGKNGAGKGEIAQFLQEIGFTYYSLSDVLRDSMDVGAQNQLLRRDFFTRATSQTAPDEFTEAS